MFAPNIARIASLRDIKRLCKALLHRNPSIRQAAEEALLDMGRDAIPYVVAFARKLDPHDIPTAAVRMLGTAENTAAVALLADITALEPTHHHVDVLRREAVVALGKTRLPEAMPIIFRFRCPDIPDQFARDSAFAQAGETAICFLTSRLRGPDSRQCLFELEKLRHKSAVPALIAFLDELLASDDVDSELATRERIAQVLAGTRDRRAILPVVRAAGQSPEKVDRWLRGIDPAWRQSEELVDAVPDLILDLHSGDSTRQRDAAIVLAYPLAPDAREPLLSLLGGACDETAVWALWSLGMRRESASISPVLSFLEGKVTQWCEDANYIPVLGLCVDAMRRFRDPRFVRLLSSLTRGWIQGDMDLGEDPCLPVNITAIQALGEIGSASAESALTPLANRGSGTRWAEAREALERVHAMRKLEDADYEVLSKAVGRGTSYNWSEAVAAIELLSKKHPDRCVHPIAEALINHDPRVRETALECLNDVNPEWYATDGARAAAQYLIERLPQLEVSRDWILPFVYMIDPAWRKSEVGERVLKPMQERGLWP